MAVVADNIALLLILGAVLFIIGAVILALALSRLRRPTPYSPQAEQGNFYDTLDDEVESSVTATRIRERNILDTGDGDSPTRAAQRAHPSPSSSADYQSDETHLGEFDVEEVDEMLITQVLTDNRFRNMIEQSVDQDEVVAWIRLEGTIPDDFELTRRGALVGRSQECDIQIKGDRAISRQHARLDVQANDTITISRLSAVNPVIVGGIQVGNHHELKTNDVIHLSDRTRLILITRTDELDEEITRIK
ncbi:MAG: FHA domain-containing protein [Anaerolineae bacterium]|nr:FHA domain-containing protein [Anaerolineae bacterium]